MSLSCAQVSKTVYMITTSILLFTSHTVMLLLARDVIALAQYWGFLKGCLLNGFLMMAHVRLNVGAKAKQNSSLSLSNIPQPLGFTENPLSLDIPHNWQSA